MTLRDPFCHPGSRYLTLSGRVENFPRKIPAETPTGQIKHRVCQVPTIPRVHRSQKEDSRSFLPECLGQVLFLSENAFENLRYSHSRRVYFSFVSKLALETNSETYLSEIRFVVALLN